jgi:cytochrome c oxidase assembly protein subunit 11
MHKLYLLSFFMFIIGSSYICFPIYRILCVLNTENTFDLFSNLREYFIQQSQPMNINTEWIRCSFFAKQDTNCISIQTLLTELIIKINEPTLSFYNITNTCEWPIIFNSHIYIIPSELELIFTKIQCFCFQEQSINSNEFLELPIFFIIEDICCKYSEISKHILIHLALYAKYLNT